MALFGAPLAEEDHAVRALHAALAIQEALRTYGDEVQRRFCVEFRMRVGVTGLVLAGGMGDGESVEYAALGDTINLAARLESAARPSGIGLPLAGSRATPAQGQVGTRRRLGAPRRQRGSKPLRGGGREGSPASWAANPSWTRWWPPGSGRRAARARSSRSSAKPGWARAAYSTSSRRRWRSGKRPCSRARASPTGRPPQPRPASPPPDRVRSRARLQPSAPGRRGEPRRWPRPRPPAARRPRLRLPELPGARAPVFVQTRPGPGGRVPDAGPLPPGGVPRAPTPAEQSWAQSHLGWAWCRAGQADRGVEVLAGLAPLFAQARVTMGEIWNASYLGEAFWRAGRLAEAGETLRALIDRAGQSGMRFYLGTAHRLLGEVTGAADASDDGRRRAAGHFEQSIAVLSEIGAENELALAYAGYGRLCGSGGDQDEAHRYLSLALGIFERLGTLAEPDQVREDLARLGCGPVS